jgi:hypothetical protein
MIPVSTEVAIEFLLKAGTLPKVIAAKMGVSIDTVYAMSRGARAMDASRQRLKNLHLLTDPDLGQQWRDYPAEVNIHCPGCSAHVTQLSRKNGLCRACELRKMQLTAIR